MANFLLLYVFISTMPIFFVLVAWHSIHQSRESAWQRASPTAARLREHLFFRPPRGGTKRRGTTGDKHQADARSSWVGVELEMQNLHTWRREVQEVEGRGAHADGLPKVLVVPSNPATTDSITRAAHHSFITAELHEDATGETSNSRSRAHLMPMPTVATIPDADMASTIEGPCANPQPPVYKSWWELSDDDGSDVVNDRHNLIPSFNGEPAVPGMSSVFRPWS